MAKPDKTLGIRSELPVVLSPAQTGVVAVLLVVKVGLKYGGEMDISFHPDVIVKVERSVEGQSLKVPARVLIFV
jgi:hypothetical protein